MSSKLRTSPIAAPLHLQSRPRAISAFRCPSSQCSISHRATLSRAKPTSHLRRHDSFFRRRDGGVQSFAITAVSKTQGDVVLEQDAELSQYEPASTWDGLELVGGEKEWNEGVEFQGFAPSQSLETREEITIAVYRAVVETLALKESGRPLSDGSIFSIPSSPLVNNVAEVKIEYSNEDLSHRLRYPNEMVRSSLLNVMAQEPITQPPETEILDHIENSESEVVEVEAASESEAPQVEAAPDSISAVEYSTEALQQIIEGWGTAWLHVPFLSQSFKFTVLKRFTQLSGLRLPDHLIARCKTADSLLKGMLKPQPPKQLARFLEENEQLGTLPNVTIMNRRETPIDREKRLGRWKVIESELEKRNLPVTEDRGKQRYMGESMRRLVQ